MNDASEVKLHFLDYWRTIRLRAGLIALAFLLVMITAGVTVYFMPRQYMSKVTMEVKPDNSGPINIFGQSGSRGMDPQFVSTQFNILQKTEILYQVIENLKLVEAWSTEGRSMQLQSVYGKLLGMFTPRELRNTGLIELIVLSTDPQEAANIANTIAIVYQQKRVLDLQKNVDKGMEQLKDEVEKQRKRADEAAVDMAKIRERDGIIDPNPTDFGGLIGDTDRNLQMIQGQLNESRVFAMKLKGQMAQILKLKPEELKEALRTIEVQDSGVEKLMLQLQDAATEYIRLFNAGLGENHPRLTGLKELQEMYSSQLAAQLNTVRSNLGIKIQLQDGIIEDLSAKMEEAKTAQIADKAKANDYIDAKTRFLQAKRIYEAAQTKYATELLQRGIDFDPAKIWEKAEPGIRPVKPKVAYYMALAALLGLMIGIGLAFFIEYLDTSVKTLDDVERYLQIPVLAVIPKDVSMLIKSKGDTADAEAYRILRANVEFNKPDGNANTFTLVSGGPGEGKSTTLNNLAFTCAKGGYNVLVVDADLRRPTQHYLFDVENDFGLTDYLTGKADLEEITRTTKIDNLSFIPSGQIPDGAVGILNSQRMVEMIAKAKGLYDLVFFDSPPILGVSDGSVLASEVDVTVMVVQHRRFPRAMLLRVKQAVQHAGGTLIGVVLNNVDTKHDEGYNYYNTYNDYYNPKTKEASKREAATAGAAAPARPRSTEREEY